MHAHNLTWSCVAVRPMTTKAATLWINQVPFSASKLDVATHFAAAVGTSAEALAQTVRMIVKDGKFAGTCFVDVTDWSRIEPALALHQSSLRCADGAVRCINVREAVDKAQLAKLTERSASKRPVVLAKAFGKKGIKTGSRVPTPVAAPAPVPQADPIGEEEDDMIAACVRWAEAQEPAAPPPREDMQVRCKDCGSDFVFTVIEQDFFVERGWNMPRLRCKACAQAKKAAAADRPREKATPAAKLKRSGKTDAKAGSRKKQKPSVKPVLAE